MMHEDIKKYSGRAWLDFMFVQHVVSQSVESGMPIAVEHEDKDGSRLIIRVGKTK